MKKHLITVLTLLAIPWHFALSQHLDFEVRYQLTTHTMYKVNEADISKLLPQDTIKLLSETKSEQVHEQFFDDGSTRIESNISYPTGLLEDWIDPIDRVVTTDDKVEAYIHNALVYSDTIDNSTEHTHPSNFAAFYLATNNWQLPLTDQEITEYELSGYEIIENSPNQLCITNPTLVLRYDKNNWSETYIELDLNGNEVFRKLTMYAQDEDGYLMYDFIQTTSIDTRTEPCIEKIVYEDYNNIERIYHNPTCAPTADNGYTHSTTASSANEAITVHQIEGTNTVYLSLPPDIPEVVTGVVKDIYGGIVIEHIMIHANEPYVDLGQLPTGVYHFGILDHNLISGKFLYQP